MQDNIIQIAQKDWDEKLKFCLDFIINWLEKLPEWYIMPLNWNDWFELIKDKRRISLLNYRKIKVEQYIRNKSAYTQAWIAWIDYLLKNEKMIIVPIYEHVVKDMLDKWAWTIKPLPIAT